MLGFRLFAILIFMVLCLALAAIGCTKSQPPMTDQPAVLPQAAVASPSPLTLPKQPAASAANAQSKQGQLDTCALLSDKEIQQVQREAVKERKASRRSEGGLNFSQCFFALPTFTNSISLAVTQRGDGSDARDPREFWREKFLGEEKHDRGKDEDREKGEGKGPEDEGKEAPPLKIQRVGDQAFWTGSAVGGALYVLKGNAFVRVSIGGAGDQRSKITKSTALAQFVLKHL